MRSLAGLVLGALGALLTSPALAGDADFRLAARDASGQGLLFACTAPGAGAGGGCGGFAPRNDRFRALASQLGMVLAPRLATPAETLGHSGFHISAAWTGSLVASDEPYWGVTEQAQRTGEASGLLQTLQLDVRKGLPFSLEVGAQLQWLIDSEIFAPGLELRWALEENHDYLPDLGLRAAVSHMVGNRDMGLTTAAFEGSLSKDFGLFGMMNVAPYAGWAVILPAARSRIIDPTPAAFTGTPLRPDVENDFVFEGVDFGDVVNHRLTAGLRVLVYVVSITVQGEFHLVGEEDRVFGVTTKFGLDF